MRALKIGVRYALRWRADLLAPLAQGRLWGA